MHLRAPAARLPLALLLALAAPVAARAVEPVACPPSLELRPADATEAPAGWRLVARPGTRPVPRPQTQPLDFAELFVGDPVDLVQLRGEDENYPVHIWWDIVPTEANTLICRYRGTNAVLQAALPLGTTRCDIRRLNARGEPIRGRTLPPGARTEVTCR